MDSQVAQAVFGLGVPELLIILAVVLLLFGGSRLAGLGKSTGRALKEFKQETRSINDEKNAAGDTPPPAIGQEPTRPADTDQTSYGQTPYGSSSYQQAPYEQAPQSTPERDGEYRRDA